MLAKNRQCQIVRNWPSNQIVLVFLVVLSASVSLIQLNIVSFKKTMRNLNKTWTTSTQSYGTYDLKNQKWILQDWNCIFRFVQSDRSKSVLKFIDSFLILVNNHFTEFRITFSTIFTCLKRFINCVFHI